MKRIAFLAAVMVCLWGVAWAGNVLWPLNLDGAPTTFMTPHGVVVSNSKQGAKSLTDLGTSHKIFHGNASGDPTWGPVNLSSEVTGSLVGATSDIYTSTGSASTSHGSAGGLTVDGVDCRYRTVLWTTAGSQIWEAGTDNTCQTSTKTGNNWEICSFTNGGVFIDCPLKIARATGIVDFADGATIGGSNVLKASDIGSTVQGIDPALTALSTIVNGVLSGIITTPSTHTVGLLSYGPCLQYTAVGAGELDLTCTTLAGFGITDATVASGKLGLVDLPLLTQFDKVDATLASVTGLSIPVVAGGKYHFRGMLLITADATGGLRTRMGGTLTISSVEYILTLTCLSTGAAISTSDETDFTTVVLYSAGCTNIRAVYEGDVQVSGNGTLTPRIAQNSASGTTSVRVNSQMTYTKQN